MNLVTAGASDDVNRAAGSQVCTRIQARTADLEFLNRFVREICCGGTDGFVGYINAVHLNTRGASAAPADRNADKLVFRRIEISAVARLHSGLQLREVEEVPAVERKVVDLFRGDDAVDR